MSDSTLPPEQWRPLFDKIGVEFGYRPFAAHIGMDHTRLRRLLRGGGTSTDAIRQVADGFRVDPSVVRELRGERGQHVEPFTLPDDAGRLNETERNVVRAVVRALLDARDNAHATDQPAADPPATTEDTQDQASEGQKTVVQVRTLADQLQYFADSAERTAQAAADLHELDPLAPPNPQLAYMLRKQVGFWQEQIDASSPEDRVTLQIELDRALRWISKFPSEQELKAKIRESESPAQVRDLAPDGGKPHELRGTQDPFDDPNPNGAEWPDGTVVTPEEQSGYLQWLVARRPKDFEPYRAGERNDYDLAARETDERKGADPAGLDDGEE